MRQDKDEAMYSTRRTMAFLQPPRRRGHVVALFCQDLRGAKSVF